MPAVIVALLLAVFLQGPAVLKPGDGALRSRCTEPATDTFELLVATPGQPDRAVSTLRRSRARTLENGLAVCVLIQEYQRAGSSDVDTSVVEATSLAPVRYAAKVGAERHAFRFTADSVVGTVQVGDSAPVGIAQPAPRAYFLAVPDIEVLRALPLAVGYQAQFESYNPPRGFHTTTVRVEAIDTLSIRGRRENAWRIAYGAGAAPTIIWLGQADRRLLRSRSELRDGAVFWRRLTGERD